MYTFFSSKLHITGARVKWNPVTVMVVVLTPALIISAITLIVTCICINKLLTAKKATDHNEDVYEDISLHLEENVAYGRVANSTSSHRHMSSNNI